MASMRKIFLSSAGMAPKHYTGCRRAGGNSSASEKLIAGEGALQGRGIDGQLFSERSGATENRHNVDETSSQDSRKEEDPEHPAHDKLEKDTGPDGDATPDEAEPVFLELQLPLLEFGRVRSR